MNFKFEVTTGYPTTSYKLFVDDDHKASGKVTHLPGNGQVGISHDVFVIHDHKNKGYGSLFQTLRLNHMKKNLGFDYVICTVNADNIAQNKIMKNNGWHVIDRFNDLSLGHLVLVYRKKLT